jgi:hypothetical protein
MVLAEGTAIHVHVIKTIYESVGISPLISNFGARDKWSSSRTGHFTPGEKKTPPLLPIVCYIKTRQSSDICGRIWGSAV